MSQEEQLEMVFLSKYKSCIKFQKLKHMWLWHRCLQNKLIFICDQCLQHNLVNTRNHAKIKFQIFKQAWISKTWKPKLNLERYTYVCQAFWISIALLAYSSYSPSLDSKQFKWFSQKVLYKCGMSWIYKQENSQRLVHPIVFLKLGSTDPMIIFPTASSSGRHP